MPSITADVTGIRETADGKFVKVLITSFDSTPEIITRPRARATALRAVGFLNTIEDEIRNPDLRQIERLTTIIGTRRVRVSGGGRIRVSREYTVRVKNF